MKLSSALGWVGFGVLIISNIWQLYVNYQQRNQVEESRTLTSSLYHVTEQTRFRYSRFGESAAPPMGSTLNGETIDSSYFSSHRGTILVFLSENCCEPCVDHEVEWWNKLAREHPSDLGLVFIARLPTKESILRLFKEYKLSFPVILDDQGELYDRMRIDITPMVFFIDRESRILIILHTEPDDLPTVDRFYQSITGYLTYNARPGRAALN